jgi:nucleotide-binding universal stress UspA family protein
MLIEKILVATDGSDLAVRAAQVAVLLAGTGARRIVAFSVAQPHFSMATDALAATDAGLELRRAGAAAIAHVETVARFARSAGVACDTATRIGSAPGREIVQAAQEHGCDLIVMGAHGPFDANTLFTGSVAQHVLAWSPIPVLLLRDPREASKPEFADLPAP